MSNNCFVKKLKGTLTDNSLPVYNTLVVNVVSNTAAQGVNKIQVYMHTTSDSGEIDAENGGQFSLSADLSNPINHLDFTSSAIIYAAGGNYPLFITNVNSFEKFIVTPISVPDFRIDVGQLGSSPTLSQLYANRCAIGNIEELNGCTELAIINLQWATQCTGDITKALGNMSKLVTFAVQGSGITGEINSLAAKLAPIRNNNSLAITCSGLITLNGEAVDRSVVKTIYWGTAMEGHDPTSEETTQGWCVR